MKNSPVYAGVAKVDITNRDPQARILDRLFAKVLVLRKAKTTIVTVAMDTTCIGGRAISDGMLPDGTERLRPALQAQLARRFGIDGENLFINASHTHPAGKILCGESEQIGKITDAIGDALGNLIEVRLGCGSVTEKRLTINRDLKLKNGSDWTLRHTNPSPWDDEIKEVRPMNPEVGVIRIDRLDGTPLAAVYNFACHPLFGDAHGRISANFVKYASDVIESCLGHGAMALFLQGTGGDVIDRTFKTFTRPREVETMGNTLGLSALSAWRKITPKANAALDMKSVTLQFPRKSSAEFDRQIAMLKDEQSTLLKEIHGCTLNFKNFITLFLQYRLNPEFPLGDAYDYMQDKAIGNSKRVEMDQVNRKLIDKYLVNVHAMEKLARLQDDIETLKKHRRLNAESGSDTIPSLLQVIRIGNGLVVCTGVEPLTQIGINIRKASPSRYTFIAGFSNDYLHYGTPSELYHRQGYEVTECCLGVDWQQIFEENVLRLISTI